MANYKPNKTTWSQVDGDWRHGKTTVIRVPVALVDQIRKYAIALDKGEVNDVDSLLAKFIEVKKTQYRRTGLKFAQDVPTWKIFNEFLRWLKLQS